MTTKQTPQPTAEQPAESLRDLALEEAALDLLAARVAAAKKDVRARMQAALDAAAARDGVERIAATLPTGQQVATISLRKGESGPVVDDEEALARWVRQTWPDEEWTETRIVRTVKPWKLRELIAQMEAIGAPTIPHPETGEALEPPGVVWKPTRARTHALTWRKDGRELVAEAWRSGDLAAHVLPALAPSAPTAPPAEEDSTA